MANRSVSSVDLRIARVAERQYGVFSRTQALTAGATPKMIKTRLASGRWLAVFRSVYLIRGTPQTWEGRVFAACLAAGPGAVASHRTAAALWQLEGIERGMIELLVPHERRPRVPDVTVRRATHLPKGDVTTIGKIPATRPPKTVINLAAVLRPEALEIGLEDAWRRKLVSIPKLLERVAELPGAGWPGIGALRGLLEDRARARPTGSGKEVRFEQILRAAGEPLPERQYPVVVDGHRFRLDHAYVDEQIFIEIDSGRWHSGMRATTKDRRRQNLLVVKAGWLPLRFMSTELDQSAEEVVAIVRKARADRRAQLSL